MSFLSFLLFVCVCVCVCVCVLLFLVRGGKCFFICIYDSLFYDTEWDLLIKKFSNIHGPRGGDCGSSNFKGGL